jgi:hypothetical protein
MSGTQTITQSGDSTRMGGIRTLSSSVLVWLALVAFIIIVKVILTTLFPDALRDPAQAALFEWMPLGIISLLGLAGVLLSERTGFPEAWDKKISNSQRVAIPILAGLAFGAAMVVLDSVTHFTALLAAAHGLDQQYSGFLPMLLAFSVASIIVEVVYRLLPIPLLLGLISNLLLRGRWQAQIFWVLAVLTSTLELSQDWGVLTGIVLLIHQAELFALNFTQAAFFRRYGFLAAILVRAAFYLVWHAIYAH